MANADRVDRVRRMKARQGELQSKWMSERQTDMMRVQAQAEIQEENKLGASSWKEKMESTSPGREFSYGMPEEHVLNRLTDKITERLRHEIKREYREEQRLNVESQKDVASKMQSYMENKLHTHTCLVCLEVMQPPAKVPMMLFPCGHTFCSRCMETHKKKNPKGYTCPYCRSEIKSEAVNQSLKNLIEDFTDKKQRFEGGRAEFFDDVFESGEVIRGSRSMLASSGKMAVSGSMSEMLSYRERYEKQAEILKMRKKILENELRDCEEVINQTEQKCHASSKAKLLLQEEEDSILKEIEKLKGALLLVRDHKNIQHNKHQLSQMERTDALSQKELIQKSLKSVSLELEKTTLINEGDI